MAEEKHCVTSCREDLLNRLNDCLMMGGLWKFIGVFVTVLVFVSGVTMSIHAEGSARVEQLQKANAQQIAINTVAIARIMQTLDSVEKGQTKLENKLDDFGKEIIREVKKNR